LRISKVFQQTARLIIKNPIIISALMKQSPRNSRTEGRGMADRSRDVMFMPLNFRQGLNVPGLHGRGFFIFSAKSRAMTRLFD
jgi:hypothetical protein